jgi:hypothetical protein
MPINKASIGIKLTTWLLAGARHAKSKKEIFVEFEVSR